MYQHWDLTIGLRRHAHSCWTASKFNSFADAIAFAKAQVPHRRWRRGISVIVSWNNEEAIF